MTPAKDVPKVDVLHAQTATTLSMAIAHRVVLNSRIVVNVLLILVIRANQVITKSLEVAFEQNNKLK